MMLMGHKDLKTTMRYIRAVQLREKWVLSVTNLPHKRYGCQCWQP